jgi:hypothetical protein
VAEARLRRSRPRPSQRYDQRRPGAARDLPRQQLRLVEAALPSPPPVERHGHDRIEPLVARQRRGQEIGERAREGRNFGVFEEVNEFAEDALVRTEAISRIKTAKAAAAQRAAAFGIEREAISKWCAATYAEVVRAEGLRGLEAGAADGDAADFGERPRANPAIVRQEEGKKGVRDDPN